jgi:hypothetical protein
MPSLQDCLLKLGRAEELLAALKAEIGPKYRRSVTAWSKLDPSPTGQLVVEIPSDPMIDLPHIKLVTGDILNCLRNTLDYLAYQLVALDTNDYWDKSQFPIITRQTRDKVTGVALFLGVKEIILGMGEGPRETYKKLTLAHRTIIERYQPYRWPQGYQPDDPLAVLATLSNKDKHRLPVATYQATEFRSQEVTILELRDAKDPHGFALCYDPDEPNTHMLTVFTKITGSKPKVKVQFDFIPEVHLEESVRFGNSTSNGVVEVLTDIKTTVTMLVEEFRPDFS